MPLSPQIEQNQAKVESDPQTVDIEKSISSTVGQFYKVRYSFLIWKRWWYCSGFCALKITLRNISSYSWSLSGKTIICSMILIKHGSLKVISVKFFLSQILPEEGSINRKIKYELFMIDVSLVSILNLIC